MMMKLRKQFKDYALNDNLEFLFTFKGLFIK